MRFCLDVIRSRNLVRFFVRVGAEQAPTGSAVGAGKASSKVSVTGGKFPTRTPIHRERGLSRIADRIRVIPDITG